MLQKTPGSLTKSQMPQPFATRASATWAKLWPYVWPSGRRDLQWRMFATLALLLIGKFVTVAVPYAFKWATDGLVGHSAAHRIFGFVAGPLALTLLYGLLRVAMAALTQARDAVFAAVAMNAVRRLANDVFVHLHLLSLRFHLERMTGGLTRILERGRDAIETIVRTVVLVATPTAVEFLLILAVFLVQFDWRYTLTVAVDDRGLYGLHLHCDQLAHQYPPNDERERYRRQYQGDRQPAQLRDREIFRRRGARGRALRQSMARYEARASRPIRRWLF